MDLLLNPCGAECYHQYLGSYVVSCFISLFVCRITRGTPAPPSYLSLMVERNGCICGHRAYRRSDVLPDEWKDFMDGIAFSGRLQTSVSPHLPTIRQSSPLHHPSVLFGFHFTFHPSIHPSIRPSIHPSIHFTFYPVMIPEGHQIHPSFPPHSIGSGLQDGLFSSSMLSPTRSSDVYPHEIYVYVSTLTLLSSL